MLLRRISQHVKDQNWFAVALDFLIVLVGVYCAVWISGLQDKHRQQERTVEIIETLRKDLRATEYIEQAFSQTIESRFKGWHDARAQGKMPPPVYFRTPGSDTPPANTWAALLNMNLGDLLHPDLVFDLAFYYSEREGVGIKFIRYVTFVEEEILPFVGENPSVFYVPDGSRLKPRFSSNMSRLREWRFDSRRNRSWAQCLDKRLEKPTKASKNCVPDFGEEDYNNIQE